MGGEGRDVVVGVDAACLDLGGDLRGVDAAARVFNLAAAVPYEGQLVILLVGRIVVQVLRGDDAAAEDADPVEGLRVGEADHARLHASHGEACDRAVRPVRDGAELLVDVRDHVLEKDLRIHLEAGAVHVTGRAAFGGTAVLAVSHNDDEREGLAVGEEVVHDEAAVALAAPAGLVLIASVMEVKDGETLGDIPVVLRRSIDEEMAQGALHVGMVPDLPDLAVRDAVAKGVLVLVVGRDLYLRALLAGAVQEYAVRVRHLCAVDNDGIVVVALVERFSGLADPVAVLVLVHREEDAVYLELDALGLRGVHPVADDAVRIDHRVLLTLLVGGHADEVLLDRRGGAASSLLPAGAADCGGQRRDQ